MCSTACLLADRTAAAGPALFFELALAVLTTAPGAGELPADADRTHHLEEASAAAFAMLGQAPLQVLARAQVVLRVLVGSIKVEQVHHHRSLLLGEGCGPSPGSWLLAFAVAAIGELVAKPAGAAGVAVVPAHRDLVRGTPARVVVVRAGEALGFRRLGRRRRGALLRAVAVVPGGLRLHSGLYGCGDLLVERPGLGLTLLLGLLAVALGLLLTGGEVGFAAVQDLLEPGQAHGGPPLQLQVVHVPHGQHDLHVPELELDVERGGRFADGPACRGGCGGWQAGGDGWFRRWEVERLIGKASEAQGAQVHFDSQHMLAGLQVLLVVRTAAGEQARIDLIERVAT